MIRNATLALVLGLTVGLPQIEAQDDGKNAAVPYRQAFDRIEEPPWQWEDQALQRYWSFLDGGPYDPELVDAYLSLNRVPLELLARGVKRDHCDFGLRREEGPAMRVDHLASAKNLAELQFARGRQLESRGDLAEAARAYLLLLPYARHVDMDRLEISSLVAIAIAGRGIEGVARIFAADAPDANTVEIVREAMGAIDGPLVDLPRASRDTGKWYGDWLRQDARWRPTTAEPPAETLEFLRAGMREYGITDADVEAARGEPFWIEGARAVEDWYERQAREVASYPASMEAVAHLDAQAKSPESHPLLRMLTGVCKYFAAAGARLEEKRRMLRVLAELAGSRDRPTLQGLGVPTESVAGSRLRLRVVNGKHVLESPVDPEILELEEPLVPFLARR